MTRTTRGMAGHVQTHVPVMHAQVEVSGMLGLQGSHGASSRVASPQHPSNARLTRAPHDSSPYGSTHPSTHPSTHQ